MKGASKRESVEFSNLKVNTKRWQASQSKRVRKEPKRPTAKMGHIKVQL